MRRGLLKKGCRMKHNWVLLVAFCFVISMLIVGCEEDHKEKTIPSYELPLEGRNPVRIRNSNDFSVTVSLRSGKRGKDFDVSANGVSTVYVPDGRYNIYFVYSSRPDALFQGDSFRLNRNGVEIQIVKVVNGNYNIRQVK
jgi:hypothetical protein